MAERGGFEPPVPVRAQRFSRPPRSTTPAPLHAMFITNFEGRCNSLTAVRLRETGCTCFTGYELLILAQILQTPLGRRGE